MLTLQFVMTLLLAGTSLLPAPSSPPRPKTRAFIVTVENVQKPRAYFASGPTEAVLPGTQMQFSFHAGKGHRLTFATMFGQSNDLFYAPGEGGLELYDAAGKALRNRLKGSPCRVGRSFRAGPGYPIGSGRAAGRWV